MATKKKRVVKKKAAPKKTGVPKKKAAPKKKVRRRVAVDAPSRITKRAPTPRLKRRRTKNTVEGYFPNPSKRSKRWYVKTGGAYFVSFTDDGRVAEFAARPREARAFGSQRAARDAAMEMNTRTLREHGIRAARELARSIEVVTLTDNPSPRPAAAAQARRLYENFSGHRATGPVMIETEGIPVGVAVGKLDGLMYTTRRDGKVESYVHEFAEHARPDLIVSADGSQLGIVGGKYRFTAHGIVDKR